MNALETAKHGKVIEVSVRCIVSRKTNLLKVRKTDNRGTTTEVSRYVRALQVGVDDIWDAVKELVGEDIEVVSLGTVEINPLEERYVIVYN